MSWRGGAVSLNMGSKDSEIILLSETFDLQDITSRESRENLYKTINTLNLKNLTAEDIERYFHGMRMAMVAFIQKVGHLEVDVFNLRKDQVALETKMEAMYLKAQLEISSLRSELNEVRLSKERMGQIVKVAKTLQGNAYAPYAIKSMVDGVVKQSSGKRKNSSNNISLPNDFTTRLYFAQSHGFKWNQNNREPAKITKKLQLLEQWEDEFCKVEQLTIDQVLDKKYISGIGPGAIAGALIVLERELGVLYEARETLSIFNCYQKAIKLYKEKQNSSSKVTNNLTTKLFNYEAIVREGFSSLPAAEQEIMISRLKAKNYSIANEVIAGIKKFLNKKTLPAFIYEEVHKTDSSKLYALQDGSYDSQFETLVKKHAHLEE